jgi:hypothetical protein
MHGRNWNAPHGTGTPLTELERPSANEAGELKAGGRPSGTGPLPRRHFAYPSSLLAAITNELV